MRNKPNEFVEVINFQSKLVSLFPIKQINNSGPTQNPYFKAFFFYETFKSEAQHLH